MTRTWVRWATRPFGRVIVHPTTLCFAGVRRRTDGAGGFFSMRICCRFQRSLSSSDLPIMFDGICSALSGSSWCPDRTLGPERRCYGGRSGMTVDEHLF
jgi:hypothetical protein